MNTPSILVVSLLLALPMTAPAAVIHVPGDQATIQAGIDAAEKGDTVLVSNGTYTGDGNRDIDFGGKAITVRSVNGAAHCTIDCEGGPFNDHRGFWFHSGEGPHSVVEGFTITDGYAVWDLLRGGGIACAGSSPTIRDCIITDCMAFDGAGVACTNDSRPTLADNSITSNLCTTSGSVGVGYGGGIYCRQSAPLIAGNDITSNIAEQGGGIYCIDSNLVITDNTIIDNATNPALFNWNPGKGGGICSLYSIAEITGNTIHSNVAMPYGGYYDPLPSHGGGLYCEGLYLNIEDNIISGNQAIYGGGIWCHVEPGTTISNCEIFDNEAAALIYPIAEGCGGGIACTDGSPAITNCLLHGNTADDQGGGIWCYGDWPEIVNCSLTANSAEGGGGVCVSSSSPPFLVNSIIWGNSPDGIAVPYGTVSVTWCDVQGGWSGEGNIDADPLFIAGPGGNHYLSQTAAGQGADSPCLDAGGDPADSICFTSGGESVCLHKLATRTDQRPDTGQADLGYHYPGFNTVSAGLDCVPSTGTLPFETSFTVRLSNNYLGFKRKVAARIMVQTAVGLIFPHWKSGWTNLDPGETYTAEWIQQIPAYPALNGHNLFTLVAEDVTPAPFNQPPYPPSGDTDTANVIVGPQATIEVPGDQPTIQAGIDAALPGDTVLVADGTWTGEGNRDLDLRGKAITLMSENGPGVCTIDCGGSESEPHRGFHFHNLEGPDSVVEGFTIRNGYAEDGGVISTFYASPMIRNCRITSNTSSSGGSAIQNLYSSPAFVNCAIDNNSTIGTGNTLSDSYSSSIIIGCTIADNNSYSSGGGINCYNSSTIIANCLISGNSTDHHGGGISCYDSTLAIMGCTIAGNHASDDGGGIVIGAASSVTVINSILWVNQAIGVGDEISVGWPTSAAILSIDWSDVTNGMSGIYTYPGSTVDWGQGMISDDPLFTSGPQGDFYLAQTASGQPADSPCLNTGSGPAGEVCYETPGRTICMDEMTTRTDHGADSGVVDMGYHSEE